MVINSMQFVFHLFSFVVDSDNYKPTIDECQTTFREYSRAKSMMMYEYTVDASRADGKEDISVNQNSFNQMEFKFNVDFDYFEIRDTVIPFQPGYIGEFRLGVIEAYIEVSQTRLPIKRKFEFHYHYKTYIKIYK